MTKMAMVQEALTHLGEVSSLTLSEYVQHKYGIRIDPKIIPVLRASLREKELLEKFREQSLALEQAVQRDKKPTKKKGVVLGGEKAT